MQLRRRNFIPCFLAVVFLHACVEHSRDEMHSTDIQVKPEVTMAYLEELLEQDPDDERIYFHLAQIYFDRSDYHQALYNVQKSLRTEDNPEYYFLRGKIYQQLNEPNMAVESFLMAESMGKKDHRLYKMLAEEYLRLKEPEQSREAIDRLTQMNKSAEAFALKGKVMLSLGDTAEAVESFNKAISIDPHKRQAYLSLADIAIGRDKYDMAFQYINKLLKLDPDNPEYLTRKGELLEYTGQWDNAGSTYRQALAQRDSYMDYYRLSNVYYMQGEYDSARYLASQALERNKEFLDAQLMIARSLDKTGQYQKAIEVYEVIVAQDSTHKLAVSELDKLRRKVAYLWRLREQRRAARDSARNAAPAPVEKKDIDD